MRLTDQELQELCNDAHDDAAEEIRELRAQLAASEARAERLAGLLLEVDDVALKIVSDYGVCDCIDNDGDAYQSQALADELQAIRAALAEGEAG